MNEIIEKGAFQIARQMFNSEIWLNKPSSWKVIWIYIIGKVNHKDNGKFKRGEGFFMPSQELKNIGCDITIDMVKKALSFLREKNMISTDRSTRGIKIKVLMYDKFQTLNNYQSTDRSTTKAPEKHQRSTTINKNDKNVKNEKKIIPKGITQSVEYGNTLVNKIIFTLKAFNGTDSLDGTVGENRKYAHLLAKNKIKPEFKNRTGSEATDEEIVASLNAILQNADDFHRKNLTNTKYIYYNFIKLIKVDNPTVIKI